MIPLITLIGYLNLFLFRHLGSTGISLILIGVLIYFWKIFREQEIPILSLLVLNIIWHDNNIVTLLSLLGMVTLIFKSTGGWNSVKIYFSSAANGLAKLKSAHKFKVPTSLIIGSILGFGVLIVLFYLLSRGDVIFATIIKSIFDFKTIFSISPRLIYTIFWFILFFPYVFTIKAKIDNAKFNWDNFGFNQELTIALLIIILGFGLYLLLSWSYLFIQVPLETDLIKFGVSTYSEYVRRGFVELLLAAGFTFAILWVGISAKLHKYLQYLLAGELVVYILTVFRRVYIYQQYHGLSVARVYGSVFLIWLIFILISELLKKPKYLAISVAVLTVMGLVNVEGYISRNNPPTVNNRIDYVYLSSISADGYYGWKMALEHTRAVLDKDWKSMKTVDMDTRREVAYASFILGNMTAKYHEYIAIYGSEAEYNNYINIVKSRNGGSYSIPVIWHMTNPFYNKGEFYLKFKKEPSLTRLDKLFTFNISQKMAYEKFQEEYGGTGVLFELQDKYYEARNKIIQTGEVDFDFDISRGRLFD